MFSSFNEGFDSMTHDLINYSEKAWRNPAFFYEKGLDMS